MAKLIAAGKITKTKHGTTWIIVTAKWIRYSITSNKQESN